MNTNERVIVVVLAAGLALAGVYRMGVVAERDEWQRLLGRLPAACQVAARDATAHIGGEDEARQGD